MTAPTDYQVRRFQAGDAAGVAECFRQIYGDSYIHPEIYHPDALVRLNESGELVSVVALALGDTIVGHYALERPGLGAIAEGGEAVVLPEHRHHRLMEDMHAVLEDEARRLGLIGLFGQSVTNHIFTQKLHERFGLVPCAINLAASPQSLHNMPEALPQRMSLLLGFKYLHPASAATLYLPEAHQAMCARIYERLRVPLQIGNAAPLLGRGKLEVNVVEHKQIAMITTSEVGSDTAAEVLKLRQELTEKQALAAVFVDLPLTRPATPDACAALEAGGFFFGGIAPQFTPSGDALRLQSLNCALDISLLQIADPLARELVDYIGCAAANRRTAT